jgi:ketosteroid isomerase-like protein
MVYRIQLAVVSLLLLVATACVSTPATLTDAERAAIADEVQARVDAFADAERRIDVEALLGFLAPDFYMYGDGVRADYASVVEQLRTVLPTLQRFETTWSDVETNVLSRDTAFTTMMFRDAITDADGVTTRMRGPTTMVWKRIDDRWLIAFVDADHYPDPAP